MIRSGELNHKIAITKLSGTQDDYGSEIEDYVDVFSAKANVRVLSAAELLKSGLALTVEYITIKMRFDSRLNHDHFISYLSNKFAVNSIRPNDKMTEMIVTASRDIV